MNKVFLILGGNIGKRDEVMFHAMRKIDRQIGKIVLQSGIYETAAWGYENQNPFYNCVLAIETDKSAREVLEKVLSIENQIGRVRSEAKWQERLIDIDILFYNNLILDEGDLKIPHPLLHKRKFTLLPLQEIAPELVHPILHKTISELLSACEDKLEAKKVMEAKLFMDFISN
ncbi:MAG: 2-amino-4-hydroxy-6-hydroxymethyldihydropteridine diphosphokinase [Bacteroidetes bacterium]|nr:2-amino-4-hydroxy-6-hydroxymethyldihydropteridine diphosphokinase [Bacteroidota bacterium]